MNKNPQFDYYFYCVDGIPVPIYYSDDIEISAVELLEMNPFHCAAWDEEFQYCRLCGSKPNKNIEDDLK